MSIEVDSSDINALVADLTKAPREVVENVKKAVEVTARRVKDDWRDLWQGSESVPGAARSITYDLRGGNAIRGAEITAEIGPELGGSGSLVGMLEYGTPTTGPRGYGAAALQRNLEDFEAGLLKAAGDAL